MFIINCNLLFTTQTNLKGMARRGPWSCVKHAINRSLEPLQVTCLKKIPVHTWEPAAYVPPPSCDLFHVQGCLEHTVSLWKPTAILQPSQSWLAGGTQSRYLILDTKDAPREECGEGIGRAGECENWEGEAQQSSLTPTPHYAFVSTLLEFLMVKIRSSQAHHHNNKNYPCWMHKRFCTSFVQAWKVCISN